MADPKIPTPRECGRALWWLARYAHHIVFVEGAEVKSAKGKVIEESTRSTRVVVAAFTAFLLTIFGKRYPDLWWYAAGGLLLAVFGLAATGDFATEDEEEDDHEEDHDAGEQDPEPAEEKPAGEDGEPLP